MAGASFLNVDQARLDQQTPPSTADLSVAIVHDWLVSYGGSERVVEEIMIAFPTSTLRTSVYRRGTVPPRLRPTSTTALQRIPGAADHHAWLLPLMPLAWRLGGPIRGVDVMVSSSHSCAKAVRPDLGVPHVCYCHTPMRYAWDFDAESRRLTPALRPVASAMMSAFRRWDRRTVERVTQFVANSTTVAERIRRSYGREAVVVHPPVRTDYFTPGDDGKREDFFLYVGRLVGYKRPDVVVRAFEGRREHLVVVGDGADAPALKRIAGPNVTFLGRVDDEDLVSLYRRARALVFVADEDFGIAMAEAQACGTPVIALARGGALDIVDHGRTGILVKEQSATAIRGALDAFPTVNFDPLLIASEAAARFSAGRFRRAFSDVVYETVRRAT